MPAMSGPYSARHQYRAGGAGSPAGFAAAISSMSMPPSVENRISGLRASDVVQNGGIKFACNMRLLLDKHAFDRVTADAHAEDLLGGLARFVGRVGELDAAGLSTLCRPAPAP